MCQVLILGLATLVGTSACSSHMRPRAVPATQSYRLAATIQDLMAGQIDPSADALWDSVAIIQSSSGTEDRHPRTAAEWQAVRGRAVTLIEAGNLLRMPGRRARSGDTPPGPGELSAAEIQQRIDVNHDNFVQFADVLQDAGFKALAAIDARNAQALMDAGGIIDEACEACHVTYWYPNQSRPGT